MTIRQKVLKAIYPLVTWAGRVTGNKSSSIACAKGKKSIESFYNLSALLNNGDTFSFQKLKGKKVLIVNTASNCGYTNQYDALQELHTNYGNNVVVLGFPANDFKEQEKGSDDEIASFCKLNYGVSFSLMKKSVVLKTAQQNTVFKWLTNAALNGWNDAPPIWNFSKYLINEDGELIHIYEPAISPMSEDVLSRIK